MLHDLYMLSCYFEPAQAVLFEDELKRRYGAAAVQDALNRGWVERFCPPCAKGTGKPFFRLSQRGLGQIESVA